MPFFTKKQSQYHLSTMNASYAQQAVPQASPPPPYYNTMAAYPQSSQPHIQPYSTPPAQYYSAPANAYQLPAQSYSCPPGPSSPPQPIHSTWYSSLPRSPPNNPAVLYTQNSGSNLYERIGDKFGDVISLIDEECFGGGEDALYITLPISPPQNYIQPAGYPAQDQYRTRVRYDKPAPPKKKSSQQDKAVNVFSKVHYYSNSRLPMSLPPLRVYMPTYPLLCLAAQYSASAYHSPLSSAERKDFVSADNRMGTKAMVVKSVPCDDKKTIVFAIRGTSLLSLRDWGTNLATDPVSPVGFLDDDGNLCHSGFLKVAKAMIRPIAARLRYLLEENPNRTSCSLLITGHSAGGAVASLLYSHMLSEKVQSDLNILTGCFKRVHCVTFGAPPVSLLPLQKPGAADGRLRKCLFHSFINEGDPVARAEISYIRSLIDLWSRPIPPPLQTKSINTLQQQTSLAASMSKLDLSMNMKPSILNLRKIKQPIKPVAVANTPAQRHWSIPNATLSNAGRLVVLRVPQGTKRENDVTASIVTDEQLRGVVFGDPLAHAMELYASRIEMLAVRAVTCRGDILE